MLLALALHTGFRSGRAQFPANENWVPILPVDLAARCVRRADGFVAPPSELARRGGGFSFPQCKFKLAERRRAGKL